MTNKLLRRFFFLFCIVLIAGCARQTTPTGGPKDTIPPTLLNSFPTKDQTNFTASTIELDFDEFVGLNNPKEQILITPDINKKFEVVAKKRKVVLTIEEPLQENTTYSVNFREAIQDLTEKNPTDTLKLAFSTGKYIDSLQISGKVINPLENKELKDATVALYAQDTFNIFKHRPTYITKTNEKGNFRLENLKPGQYYIYSFDDKNKNLVVDSRNESYGFRQSSITLEENQRGISLAQIRLDARPLKLTSARPYNTYYNIKFSKGVKQYQLIAEEVDTLVSIISEDPSTIKVYKSFDADSAAVKISALDSMDQKVDTTVYVKFIDRKQTPEKFTIGLTKWKAMQEKGQVSGIVTYNKPISTINFDSIEYRIDSLNSVHFTKEEIRWEPAKNQITFSKKIDPKLLAKAMAADDGPEPNPSDTLTNKTLKKIFKLLFKKGSLISVEGDSSAAINENLKPIGLEETGTIAINVQTSEPNFIVELVDKSFKPVAEAFNQKKVTFEDLIPGEYQIRLIIDRDKNRSWSPGQILIKKDTEPIVYYRNDKKSTVVTLKANWEIGPLLISF